MRWIARRDCIELISGVPLLTPDSVTFTENEPIVCRPEEMLDCFLRTKMDLLMLGKWMLEPAEKGT